MLYICPTPIGNLEDITLRTIKVLQSVDVIACEDTRHSMILLNHLGINKKTVSLHEHNERKKSAQIVEMLKTGLNAAYISDAGMPCISDPGFILLNEVKKANLPYTVLPGASAQVTAFVGANVSDKGYFFVGFLPYSSKDRTNFLQTYKNFEFPIIIYEAPHKIKKTLNDIYKIWGNRKFTIAREITKKFEEYIDTDIETMLLHFDNYEIRGEFILVFNPPVKKAKYDTPDIEKILKKYIESGLKSKDIISETVKETGCSKNEIYALYLKIKDEV